MIRNAVLKVNNDVEMNPVDSKDKDNQGQFSEKK